MQGKNLVTQKLNISTLAGPEILGGVSLGVCAVRDPRLEALARPMRWLVSLANSGGIARVVHPSVATLSSPAYREPSAALQNGGIGVGMVSGVARL